MKESNTLARNGKNNSHQRDMLQDTKAQYRKKSMNLYSKCDYPTTAIQSLAKHKGDGKFVLDITLLTTNYRLSKRPSY